MPKSSRRYGEHSVRSEEGLVKETSKETETATETSKQPPGTKQLGLTLAASPPFPVQDIALLTSEENSP